VLADEDSADALLALELRLLFVAERDWPKMRFLNPREQVV
jgi:hypothetical protein